MNRYLLLILLSSWSLLVTNSHQCDTGVAMPGHLLSVQRSSLANADVAFLQLYNATSVERCMEDCCAGKYGDCTVASYEKSTDKCRHFSCRPLNKCKFLSSTSIDSFTFSSSSHNSHLVPSSNTETSSTTTTTTTTEPRTQEQTSSEPQHKLAVTKEQITTFTEEQFALKNDNTTIKPRKGVDELMPGVLPGNNVTRSGIKPRKGVTMEDVPHSKYLSGNNTRSKVKPRKGVGPYTTIPDSQVSATEIKPEAHASSTPTIKDTSISKLSLHSINHYADDMSNDLISALEKVFEDEPHIETTKASISPSSVEKVTSTRAPASSEITSSSVMHTTSTSSSIVEVSTTSLWPSYSTHYYFPESSSKDTPDLGTSSMTSEIEDYTMMPLIPSVAAPAIMEQSTYEIPTKVSLGNLRLTETDEESENERKYKSSMHLVLSLVFGLLVLFAVLGVVAKRVYDGWLRRHYRRMDFLIDGMYNGYG